MDVNKKLLEEFKELEKKYPLFIKRILERGEWLAIMFWRIYDFLKKLGLEKEFTNSLTKNELISFNTAIELRNGDIKIL